MRSLQNALNVRLIVRLVLIVVIFLVPTAASFAIHPVPSHRAETHGKNNKSVSFNYSYEYEEDKATGDLIRTNAYDTILSYGLLENLDIVAEVPLKQVLRENSKDYSGFDDISIEAKWKFYDTEAISLAVYPEVTFPTGKYSDGVGNGKATFRATLIASKHIDRFSFHLSGQYTRNENKKNDRLDLWEIHFSPEVAIIEGLTLVGDVGLRRDSSKINNKLPFFASGGLSYAVTENFSISPTFKSEWNDGDKKDLTFIIASLLKF